MRTNKMQRLPTTLGSIRSRFFFVLHPWREIEIAFLEESAEQVTSSHGLGFLLLSPHIHLHHRSIQHMAVELRNGSCSLLSTAKGRPTCSLTVTLEHLYPLGTRVFEEFM